MDDSAIGAHNGVRDLKPFTDAGQALARIRSIYDDSIGRLRHQVQRFLETGELPDGAPACYPYVGVTADRDDVAPVSRLAYGSLPSAGTFGTTLTRPDILGDYYHEQLELLLSNYGRPLAVGISDSPIPLPFVLESTSLDVTGETARRLQQLFHMPDLTRIDDRIANGTLHPSPGRSLPLALFSGERVDYSLVRLKHYTATSPGYFQRFVLFTNYQRYVEEFVAYGRRAVEAGDQYTAFVEPGDRVRPNPRLGRFEASGNTPSSMPQMPAYHLLRDDHEGITLVNIGVGPSNAKTITDHIAVLRPHCWLMIGHCGGLRKTQRLGDYVLAHAYARSDHVLDEDLPAWVPVPPIAEVQVALTSAVASVTGLKGSEMKVRLRTGTVFTTDDRDWELRYDELALRINQSRAIAVDMESATIAANGYRLRVPYGTLLCVSDKPLHGELKLPGMANAFYQERVSQHLQIGLATINQLREAGVVSLHSRKLRSFDEPAFR